MTPNIQIVRKNILPTPPMKTKKRTKSRTNRNSFSSEDKENENNHDPLSMDPELEAGISLIVSFIQKSRMLNKSHSIEDFHEKLLDDLKTQYTGHWYPDRPEKGSAFRCLRINQNGSESLIEKSARESSCSWIAKCLPQELTIWIDPGEVSYRIGEDGSICVHFYRNINLSSSKNAAPVQ